MDYENAAARGWQSNATLVFNYAEADHLVPTFAFAFASRRYSLSMMVRMDGYQNARFRLRVPLQVVYTEGTRHGRACEAETARSGHSERMHTEGTEHLPPMYTAE